MNELSYIGERIQDTEAALARLNRQLAAHPGRPSILLEIRSLEKMRRGLESEFSQTSAQLGLEVCNYRIISETGHVRVSGLGAALQDYQNVFSVFYDAIKSNRPKERAKIGSEIGEESAFEFGYAYAGSVGFVLTVPNERMLFDTVLDQTVQSVFETVRADRPEQIREIARHVGPAPIRAIHKWATANVANEFSVEILWRRGDSLRNQVLIQHAEFKRLRQAISETSDERVTEFVVTGQLVGVDVKKDFFRILPDSGGEIRGAVVGTIDEAHTVELPKRYRATIRKTTKIVYSTDEEKPVYELLRVEQI